jgi:hypothetical protein
VAELQNVRSAIETLLAALLGEATLADGITLRLERSLTMTLARSEGGDEAILSFDSPPAIHVRRGPIHFRCTLAAVVLTPEQVHAKLDGWFDRRWQVVS